MTGAPNPEQQISPAARIHLSRNRLFVKDIKATGKNGILLKQDVMRYLKDPVKYGTDLRGSEKTIPTNSVTLAKLTENDQVVKVDKKRNTIYSQSKSIPSFVFSEEYDVTDLLKFEKEGYSMLSMVIKSVSIGLTRFPNMNSITNPDVDSDGYIHEYVLKKDHNICIAHCLPEGVSLPYLKKVQDLPLGSIEGNLKRVTTPDFEVDKSQLGTFTIYHNKLGTKLFPNIIRPQT